MCGFRESVHGTRNTVTYAISPSYVVSMRVDVNTYNELELSALNSLTTEKDNVESFWRTILDIILVKNYLYPTPAM